MLSTVLTCFREWFKFRSQGTILGTWTADGLISVKDLIVLLSSLVGLLRAISLIASHSLLLMKILVLIDIFIGLHTFRFVLEARLIRAYRLIILTFRCCQHTRLFRWMDYKLLIPKDHLVVTKWGVVIFWDIPGEVIVLCPTCFKFAEIEFWDLWCFCSDEFTFAYPVPLNRSCSFSPMILHPSSFLPSLLLRIDR